MIDIVCLEFKLTVKVAKKAANGAFKNLGKKVTNTVFICGMFDI